MRNDPFPVRNYLTELKEIVAAKRGKYRRRLDRLMPFLAIAYWNFIAARASLETVPRRTWKPEAKVALQHCYEQTQARNRILREIEEAVVPDPYLCPYCLMRHPKSWDHYLPQNHSPEYSVLALNLILICETCNRRKSDQLVDTPRSVLNPYFDQLPLSPVLHCDATLTPRGIGLTFSIIVNDPTAPAHLQGLLERHSSAFGLFKEYSREGSAYASEIITTIAVTYRAPITQAVLDRALDARMRGLRQFPPNSWQGAVIEALEAMPGILGYVNRKIAATPPAPRLRPRRDLTALRAAAAANALANP